MKLRLISLGILVIQLIGTSSYAQSMGANHRKYWWYKSRLNNDFVKVGLNADEMNKLLLKKIEEMTIMMVPLKKEINELKNCK
ncbi:MAG: hypothetical protein ACK504_01735 [Bacteroidota bacterium]